jgi:hypothetical protein
MAGSSSVGVATALVGLPANVRLDIACVRVTRVGARVDLQRSTDGRANIDDAKLKSGGLRTQHYADGAQKRASTKLHGESSSPSGTVGNICSDLGISGAMAEGERSPGTASDMQLD